MAFGLRQRHMKEVELELSEGAAAPAPVA
jgi:hypothetical protein